MLGSTALLATMHALVRYVGGGMHPFEVAFFRNLFGLIVILPLLWRAGRAGLRTAQPRLQILRAVLGVVAMLCWFYGLSIVPIAEATALSFTAAIFASLGAVLILGEKMRLRRWTAVLLGFAGTLVVLRPGFEAMDLGSFIVLVAAVAWGLSIVVVKQLSGTDSTVSIVAWMSIMLTVLSFLPALFVWTWPTFAQLLWLGLIGTLATLGHLAMVQALKAVEATAILPLDFTRLLWASLLGYFAFAEVPDLWTWIGGTIIFGSATYIAYREARLKRTAATPGPSGAP